MFRDKPSALQLLRSGRSFSLEVLRYFAASLIALSVDVLVLLTLVQLLHYAIAATISFLVGALVHYAVSVRFVFQRRKFIHRKSLESSVFVAAGLIGLVVNVLVLAACIEWLAFSLIFAKLTASGASFIAGYALRKRALF